MKIRIRDLIVRLLPPGFPEGQAIRLFWIGNSLSAVVGLLGFLANFSEARDRLFDYIDGKRLLIDGACIDGFSSLLGHYFMGFVFVTFWMLVTVVSHYAYYRQGSMSLYLMKRLPKRNERHLRAWAVPCLSIALSWAVALFTVLICFVIYLIATPRGCLPYFRAGQEIGRYVSCWILNV